MMVFVDASLRTMLSKLMVPSYSFRNTASICHEPTLDGAGERLLDRNTCIGDPCCSAWLDRMDGAVAFNY